VVIVVYPERSPVWNMSMSGEWQAAGMHRDTGPAGQIHIETVLKNKVEMLPWNQALPENVKR